MRVFEFAPKEVEQERHVVEREKEQASLQSLIDYTIQCAMETNVFSAEGRLDDVRRQLCRAIL
jgi:hypothetical protein